MRVRLAKPKSKIHELLLELLGQPLICGKATNEKYELLMINKGRRSRMFGGTDRIGGKPLPEVILDIVYGTLN